MYPSNPPPTPPKRKRHILNRCWAMWGRTESIHITQQHCGVGYGCEVLDKQLYVTISSVEMQESSEMFGCFLGNFHWQRFKSYAVTQGTLSCEHFHAYYKRRWYDKLCKFYYLYEWSIFWLFLWIHVSSLDGTMSASLFKSQKIHYIQAIPTDRLWHKVHFDRILIDFPFVHIRGSIDSISTTDEQPIMFQKI